MQGQYSLKQQQAINVVKNRTADLLFLIGALGTSKTYVMASILINIATTWPNSFIPVGRKTLEEARVGTLQSFIEVLDNLGLVDGLDYKSIGLNGGSVPPKFIFPNRSVIQFVPLDHTKDREWQRIKGINATAAGVDEVDGVQESGFNMLSARVGRKNTELVNGVSPPAITIAACNPNEMWTKDRVYTPFRKGNLPKGTTVIEFNVEDSFLYKTGFYERFADNPRPWQERYLKNNWDYLDDDQSLYKSKVLDNIMVDDYDGGLDRFAGQDVAREGKDRSVTAQIVGNTLIDIKVYRKEDLDFFATAEEKKAPPYSNILGRKFIEYCHQNNIGYQNTAGDAVGLGAGFIDYCRGQEFYVDEYKAGAKPYLKQLTPSQERALKLAGKPLPTAPYDMLRSQIAVMMARDMENGQFFFYEGCPHLAELKNELLYHQYESQDKIMKVESKQKLKERLGRSPDIADSVFIAYWKMKFGKSASFSLMPSVTEQDTGQEEMPGHLEDERPITGGLQQKQF